MKTATWACTPTAWRTSRFLLPLIALVLLAVSPPILRAQSTIGGAVIGLAGPACQIVGSQCSNLVLSESYESNGTTTTNSLTFGPNTPLPNFTFPGTAPIGATYSVTISSLPSNLAQTCAVTDASGMGPGSGTVAASEGPINVYVWCWNLSGTVAGLPPGKAVTLQNNLAAPYEISSNGVFTFPQVIASTLNYNVSFPGVTCTTSICTVAYPWGGCTVMNASGNLYVSLNNANQFNAFTSNIWVTCVANDARPLPASQWRALKTLPMDSNGTVWANTMLLPDGSVLASGPVNPQNQLQVPPQEWFRLVPDNTGSYVNGTWMSVPDSICPHGAFASQVMTNGKLFVAGGESPGPPSPTQILPTGCTGSDDTEIFDPSTLAGGGNPWTAVPATSLINPSNGGDNMPSGGQEQWCPSGTNQAFLDMISETLPDGSVLMAPVCPMNCGDTLIYSPATGWASQAYPLANTGGASPTGYGCSQQEDTWVKLQDGRILTADPPSPPAPGTQTSQSCASVLRLPSCTCGFPQTWQTSELFSPSQQRWVAGPPLLFALYDNQFGWSGGGEMGPAFLLPSGKAVFIGGNPVMGIYDPVANTWSQSCIAPNGPATLGSPLSAPDVGGAMMVNGDILLALRFAATPYDVTPSPVFFYEYDYSQGAYSEVRAPGNPGSPSPWADCGQPQMLDLPDGSVLLHSSCSAQLWVYQPTGSPLQPGQPQVQTVSAVGGSCSTCYLLTGKGLDGISEGASYGDDAQIATDFPIVRVGDGIGNIAYARTFNWSNVSLLSEAPGSTYFQILGGIPACELQLVANGNPSSWFPLSQCTLASAVVPICGLQCILGSAVIWSRPNPLGDPWIDGVSLTLLTPGDPDSVELASDEQVLVDTQSLVKSEAARQIAVSGVGSTSIVGPTVELRSRAASDRRALPKGRAFAGMVSIPYEPRGLARAATVRIVRFDDLRRRWVAVPAPQKVDESKHIVTAGISGMGKFTVVAENPR